MQCSKTVTFFVSVCVCVLDGSFSVAASTLTGNIWDGSLYHFDSYTHFCDVPNLRLYSNVVASGVNDLQWYATA